MGFKTFQDFIMPVCVASPWQISKVIPGGGGMCETFQEKKDSPRGVNHSFNQRGWGGSTNMRVEEDTEQKITSLLS